MHHVTSWMNTHFVIWCLNIVKAITECYFPNNTMPYGFIHTKNKYTGTCLMGLRSITKNIQILQSNGTLHKVILIYQVAFWKTNCLEKPQNLMVAWYRFCCNKIPRPPELYHGQTPAILGKKCRDSVTLYLHVFWHGYWFICVLSKWWDSIIYSYWILSWNPFIKLNVKSHSLKNQTRSHLSCHSIDRSLQGYMMLNGPWYSCCEWELSMYTFLNFVNLSVQ